MRCQRLAERRRRGESTGKYSPSVILRGLDEDVWRREAQKKLRSIGTFGIEKTCPRNRGFVYTSSQRYHTVVLLLKVELMEILGSLIFRHSSPSRKRLAATYGAFKTGHG